MMHLTSSTPALLPQMATTTLVTLESKPLRLRSKKTTCPNTVSFFRRAHWHTQHSDQLQVASPSILDLSFTSSPPSPNTSPTHPDSYGLKGKEPDIAISHVLKQLMASVSRLVAASHEHEEASSMYQRAILSVAGLAVHFQRSEQPALAQSLLDALSSSESPCLLHPLCESSSFVPS